MGRGVVAASLAILLCHGLGWGQAPPHGGAGAEIPAVAPHAAEPVHHPPVEGDVLHAGGWGGMGLVPGLRVWAGVEYLMWFVEESKLAVPLVTQGIIDNNLPGVLGQPGTTVLLGGQTVNDDHYNGIRFRAGADFGDSGLGIEAIGFVLDQQRTRLGFPSPTANPDVLGIPIFNVNRGEEDVLQVRDPGNINGRVDFQLRTNFSGAECNLGYAVNAGVIDWAYVGYRYLNLTEALEMQTSLLALRDDRMPFLGVFQPAGTTGLISESFATSNNFNGGQFGLVKRLCYRNVSLDMRAAVALGETRQRLSIRGSSGIGTEATGITRFAVGGVFAQTSNIGDYTTNQFSVVPEVGASLYVRLLDGLLGFVGYNFLYWTNVVRPGEQIDRNVELQQAPFSRQYNGIPAGLPAVTSRRADLAVHGLNAGLAIQF